MIKTILVLNDRTEYDKTLYERIANNFPCSKTFAVSSIDHSLNFMNESPIDMSCLVILATTASSSLYTKERLAVLRERFKEVYVVVKSQEDTSILIKTIFKQVYFQVEKTQWITCLFDNIQTLNARAASNKRLISQFAVGTNMICHSFKLTRRHTTILPLLLNGKSNKEMANALAIAEVTVKKHISEIIHRLRVNNRTGAASYIQLYGLS